MFLHEFHSLLVRTPMVSLKSLQVLQVRLADTLGMPSHKPSCGIVNSCNRLLLLVFSLRFRTGEHIMYEFAEPSAFRSSDAVHIPVVGIAIISIGMQVNQL